MADSESYHIALQAVAHGIVPTYGYDVVRMIADGHAFVKFLPARTWGYGKCSAPERYIIRLTDAGKATLRALSISE